MGRQRIVQDEVVHRGWAIAEPRCLIELNTLTMTWVTGQAQTHLAICVRPARCRIRRSLCRKPLLSLLKRLQAVQTHAL
jgi:hypothetical protein